MNRKKAALTNYFERILFCVKKGMNEAQAGLAFLSKRGSDTGAFL